MRTDMTPSAQAPSSSNSSTAATAIALTATLTLAAASWVLAALQMTGMDMGPATRLGSFVSFLATWLAMMAAMMLLGAARAVVTHARADGWMPSVPVFLASYLAVWTLVGVAVYVLYGPHGSVAAGVITIAAGLYELTPLKRHCRQRCRDRVRSGFGYGLHCVGSSIGLMSMLVALGVMSLTWMAVIAVVDLAQKLLPAKAAIDVPVALGIIGLGVLILVAPSSAPGLMPPM